MFTLIPSLYLIGVHYFRQWNASLYLNDEENLRPQILIEKSERKVVEIPRVKSAKKKSHRQRRKTSVSELSRADIEYLMKQTGFTEEKILVWYSEYLRDCPDGKLSKNKFIDIYQQFYKKGRVDRFCDYAFRLFNKDGSGYLDFIEFLRAVSLTSSKDPEHKISLFFSMYDFNRNGLIDENEMRSFIESIYEMLGIDVSDPSRIDSKVAQMFSNVECDQQNSLRKEQFSLVCQKDRHIRKLLMANSKSSDQSNL